MGKYCELIDKCKEVKLLSKSWGDGNPSMEMTQKYSNICIKGGEECEIREKNINKQFIDKN